MYACIQFQLRGENVIGGNAFRFIKHFLTSTKIFVNIDVGGWVGQRKSKYGDTQERA